MPSRSIRELLESTSPKPKLSKSTPTLKMKIPTHEAIMVNERTAMIKVDNTGVSSYFLSSSFKAYCSTLLATLASHAYITKAIIAIIYPIFSSQSIAAKDVQRQFIAQLVDILSGFKSLMAVEVILKAPELVWSQVKMLVPFYGVRDRLGEWKLMFKGGEGKEFSVWMGSEWDRDLVRAYWKQVAENGDGEKEIDGGKGTEKGGGDKEGKKDDTEEMANVTEAGWTRVKGSRR